MSNRLVELILNLKAEKAKARLNDFANANKRASTTINTAWASVKKIFAATFVVQGLSVFVNKIKESVSLIIKMRAEAKRARTVFGSSFGDMTKQAKEFAATLGVTKREFVAIAATVGDMLIPIGATRKEAAELSAESIKLAGALKDFTGDQRSLAEITNVVGKAFLGEREGLKSLGVAILESDVKARIAREGLQGLTDDAMKLARAQVTMQLMTEKSSDALLAYKSGQDELLQASNKLRVKLEEMKDSMLESIAPALTLLIQGINVVLEPQEKKSAKERIARVKELIAQEKKHQALLKEEIERRKKVGEFVNSQLVVLRESEKAMKGMVTELSFMEGKDWLSNFLKPYKDILKQQEEIQKRALGKKFKASGTLAQALAANQAFAGSQLGKNIAGVETAYANVISKLWEYKSVLNLTSGESQELAKAETARLLKLGAALKKAEKNISDFYQTELEKSLQQEEDVFLEKKRLLNEWFVFSGASLEDYKKREAKIILKHDQNIAKIRIQEIETIASKTVEVMETALSAVAAIQNKQSGQFISSIGAMASLAGAQWGGVVAAVGAGISILEGIFDETNNELEDQKRIEEQLKKIEKERAEATQARLDHEKEITKEIERQLNINLAINEEAAFQARERITLEGVKKDIALADIAILKAKSDIISTTTARETLSLELGFGGDATGQSILSAQLLESAQITALSGQKTSAEGIQSYLADNKAAFDNAVNRITTDIKNTATILGADGRIISQTPEELAEGLLAADPLVQEYRRQIARLDILGSPESIQTQIDSLSTRQTNIKTLLGHISTIRGLESDVVSLQEDLIELEIKKEELRQIEIDKRFSELEELIKILDLEKDVNLITEEIWKEKKRALLLEMQALLDEENDRIEWLSIQKRLLALDGQLVDTSNQRGNLQLTGQRNLSFIDIGSRAIRNIFGGGISAVQRDLENVTLPEGLESVSRSLGTSAPKSLAEQRTESLKQIESLSASQLQVLQAMLAKLNTGQGFSALQFEAWFDSAVLNSQNRTSARAI